MHNESHPLAGKTVKLNATAVDPVQGQVVEGAEYFIEDWWDKITGGSWMSADGNFAAMHYAMRDPLNTPFDDEVVYGKIGSLGHIVHVSKLGDVVTRD